jgi:23S rRNA pseudouridine1911/1915/1917 synthase
MSGAPTMTGPDTDAATAERCTVAPADAGARLDRFLADALATAPVTLSRSRIKALLQGGMVSKNGATITDPSHRVKPDETYTVRLPPPEDATAQPQDIALTVVYEDADLLVIDKPAGLVVHPGPGQPDKTLVNALLAHCGASLSGVGGVRRPGIVHRLDKDTSGLIVVAKNDETHHALSAQFAGRTIERAYLAVVWGVPTPLTGRIEGNIGRHPRQRKKMAVVGDERGKPAATNYRVLKRFGDGASLIECRLETGRTHQIRVHLDHIGHPLIGDPVYGRRTPARAKELPPGTEDAVRAFSRQALHARVIGFDHPRTGERLKFESKPPHDMETLVRLLESKAD